MITQISGRPCSTKKSFLNRAAEWGPIEDASLVGQRNLETKLEGLYFVHIQTSHTRCTYSIATNRTVEGY